MSARRAQPVREARTTPRRTRNRPMSCERVYGTRTLIGPHDGSITRLRRACRRALKWWRGGMAIGARIRARHEDVQRHGELRSAAAGCSCRSPARARAREAVSADVRSDATSKSPANRHRFGCVQTDVKRARPCSARIDARSRAARCVRMPAAPPAIHDRRWSDRASIVADVPRGDPDVCAKGRRGPAFSATPFSGRNSGSEYGGRS